MYIAPWENGIKRKISRLTPIRLFYSNASLQFPFRLLCRRKFHSSPISLHQKWSPLTTLTDPTSETFHRTALGPARPIQFPAAYFTSQISAISKWFRPAPYNQQDSIPNHEYLEPYAATTMLPMELTTTATTTTSSSPTDISYDIIDNDDANVKSKTFHRATTPFSLFLAYTTLALPPNPPPTHHITIAQSPLSALPIPLTLDLPTPSLLQKRDIYASSLWLGVAPTVTPLHRDPNPNLFVQLVGKKRIRLLPPEVGERVFAAVAEGKGMGERRGRVRGEEMMVGEEGRELEELIWDESGDEVGLENGCEVSVEAGGGLFIPSGWWHAVRGVGGGVVGSVNWWFR